MSILEKMQRAWQGQCLGKPEVDPDQVFNAVQSDRRTNLASDVFVIIVLAAASFGMLHFVTKDFATRWPWLIYTGVIGWVGGYILLNLWRRRRLTAAQFHEPTLSYIDSSIAEIRHRIKLDESSLWWYILPIAAACMLPPLVLFVKNYGTRPIAVDLIGLLLIEAFFALISYLIYWIMKLCRRPARKRQQEELVALEKLRDSLLSEDDSIFMSDE